MAVIPQPSSLPGAPSDKVLHLLTFTCLSLLGSAAYPRLSALQLISALSVFGAIIEIVQLIPELQRDAELMDWIADTVTVIAVVVVMTAWRRSREASRDPGERNASRQRSGSGSGCN